MDVAAGAGKSEIDDIGVLAVHAENFLHSGRAEAELRP